MSKKHSDLYTDENPKGTIKGLGFATVSRATASVAKIKKSGRSHAHKIQAAIAMEQRARKIMPVRKVKGGYRFGRTGKVYKRKKDAERQERAIYASGYKKRKKRATRKKR